MGQRFCYLLGTRQQQLLDTPAAGTSMCPSSEVARRASSELARRISSQDIVHYSVTTPSHDFSAFRSCGQEQHSFRSCNERLSCGQERDSFRSCHKQSFAPPGITSLGTLGSLPEHGSALNGKWEGVAGSMVGLNEFLILAGVSWAVRTDATSISSIFVPRQEISSQSNTFLIAVKTPTGSDTKEFIVDGPRFEGTFGPEKAPGTGYATWEGDVLVIRVQMHGRISESRRWRDGDRMRQTLTLIKDGKNAVLKQAYKRAASP